MSDTRLEGLWAACRKRADLLLDADPETFELAGTATELAALFRSLDRAAQANTARSRRGARFTRGPESAAMTDR